MDIKLRRTDLIEWFGWALIVLAFKSSLHCLGQEGSPLPWCTNNSHIEGEWLSYETSIRKTFVCCGGGYAGPYGQGPPYDFEKVPGYCIPKNTLPNFYEHGHVEFGAQCGDDCCICDREDNTRFVPNKREKYYWKPKNCRLHDWNATLFCELLGQRTILLMGDSSMQQTASTLMSMIVAGNGTCGPRVIFARSDHVIFGFKGHHNYPGIVDTVDPNITIVTAGAHIDDTGDIDTILNGIQKHNHFRATKNKTVPSVIWKTQNPGHQNCHAYTEPIKEFKINNSILDKYRWNDMRHFDQYTDKKCPSMGFRVLHVSPLWLRPDAHVRGAKDDCLHYCMPGPLNLFSNILLQMLFNKEV
jgi:GDSL/SGNH-like Acyl-Esterase family found in Pmr5 and Cas1p